MNRIRQIWSILALSAVAAFSSCINDREMYVPEEKSEAVTFRINVPANSQPKSRALAAADEYAVTDVTVLLFEGNPKTFRGRYNGTITAGPTGTGGASATMTFQASLPKGTFDLMIVANANYILNAAAAADTDLFEVGTPQATIEAALTADMTTAGWITDPTNANYHAMPMWCYAKGKEIKEGTHLTDMYMTRMVAKVDVQLNQSLVNTTDPGLSKFQLRSVSVYNYATSGRLIPNTDGTQEWENVTQSTLKDYIEPSLPAGYSKATFETDHIDRATVSPFSELKGELYLFEAPVGDHPTTGNDFTKNTCLIICGSFNGEADSWYRIDFAQKQTNDTYKYLPILRNNSYTVTITDVTTSGYGSAEDALNNAPANITATILDWNNNDITTIVTDGIYIFGVSQGSFEFPSDARGANDTDNRLTIVTNHSGGWTATVCSDEQGTLLSPSWVRLVSDSGDGNYPDGDATYLEVDPNTENIARTAYIHLKAGSLNYIVPVVQHYQSLKISNALSSSSNPISRLDFISSASMIGKAPDKQYIRVDWSPSGLPVSVTKKSGTLDWVSMPANPLTNAQGTEVLAIDPPGITQAEINGNPFISKTSTYTFAVGDAGVTQDLTVTQTHYALLAEGFLPIATKVRSCTATVMANAPWECTWTTNLTIGSMTVPATQPIKSNGSTTGSNFTYTFSNDAEGYVTFTFKPADPTKPFEPVVVRVDVAPQLLPTPPTVISGGTPIPSGRSVYIGAFWRADQTGERLIDIIPNKSIYNWSVQVANYGDFKPGDIVFSTTDANGNPITIPASGDDAELYQVDGTTSLKGADGDVLNASNPLRFRIGLKSKWDAAAGYDAVNKPVRYAIVVIGYALSNGGAHQFQTLFLRQGEDPDYLMRPDDLGVGIVDGRTLAKKISPYNLTHPTFKASASTVLQYTTPARSGEMTDYPTQAGALFKWAEAAGIIIAYNPAGTVSGWPTNYAKDYWNNTGDDNTNQTYDGCPPSYRRWNDGSPNNQGPVTLASVNATNSEMGQSLYVNPPTNTTNNVANSVWGYYADGFFDRRAIGLQTAQGNAGTANSAVSTGSSFVAYNGRLFYNPATNASVFFPATGNRRSTDGYLFLPGTYGYYWSGSATNENYGIHLYIGSSEAYRRNSLYRGSGFSVRCVKAE